MRKTNNHARCVLINLAKCKVDAYEPEVKDVSDRIGGWGVQLTLWKELWGKSLKENDKYPMLGISTGHLTGSGAPASACFNWFMNNDNGFAVQQVEGRLGAELRYAGFDHVLICGRSSESVHIKFDDGKVDILPAEGINAEVGITYENMKKNCEADRVIAVVGKEEIIEDNYFSIGKDRPASSFRKMNVSVVTAAGKGKIEIVQPDDFLKQCIALFENYRNNNKAEKNRYIPEYAYYLSPWKSVNSNDRSSDLPNCTNIDLTSADYDRDKIEAIVFSMLGLGWNNKYPRSNRLEHAARLLSSMQGHQWNAIQLTEMALKFIRISRELS